MEVTDVELNVKDSEAADGHESRSKRRLDCQLDAGPIRELQGAESNNGGDNLINNWAVRL